MSEKLKVSLLLEQYPGEGWSCYVPPIKGCMSQGETIEEAQSNIVPEIEYFVKRHPEILDLLYKNPNYQIGEVEVDLRNVDENARDTA